LNQSRVFAFRPFSSCLPLPIYPLTEPDFPSFRPTLTFPPLPPTWLAVPCSFFSRQPCLLVLFSQSFLLSLIRSPSHKSYTLSLEFEQRLILVDYNFPSSIRFFVLTFFMFHSLSDHPLFSVNSSIHSFFEGAAARLLLTLVFSSRFFRMQHEVLVLSKL